MKSKTYQKEGWSALEEEIRFFGENAEKQKNLESEDNFDFNHTDKELLDKKIDDAVKDLTDWLDSEPQNEIYLSDDEINNAIESLLEKTHPTEAPSSPEKTGRTKKVILRVLFIAALLSVVSVTCLFAVGNSRNVSIENGFMTFAKDTVKIVFFGEEKDETITIDMLMADLKAHGYGDILLPQFFVESSANYSASVPEYVKDELNEQVHFEISDAESEYMFNISKTELLDASVSYKKPVDAETIVLNGVYIYAFEFNSATIIEFVCDGFYYYISSDASLIDMVKIAESIK